MTDDPIGNPLDSSWLFDSNPFGYLRDVKPEEQGPSEDEDEGLGPSVPNPNRVPGPGALEETWTLIDSEAEDMADIYTRAGGSLDKMFKHYKLYPVRFDDKYKLFIARYEFPQYDKELQHKDAKILEDEREIRGFIDFLCGFPMENCEQLLMFGEWSSRTDKIDADDGEGSPVPPVPSVFFEGFDEEKTLLNLFYLPAKGVEILADDLEGEEKPTGLHWWTRINIKPTYKYPMPGEFFCLGNRQWCTLPWGEQKTNPYLFSGNWMQTVYYASGVIKEVIDPTDDVPYPTYTVTWQGQEITGVKPSDFAEFRVDDRVTILKDITTTKTSQLWKDSDMKEFDKDKWVLVPIIFYGIKGLGKGED